MQRIRVVEFLVLLGLCLVTSIPSWGQIAQDSPLTNADIVKLTKAGVSENTILRLMRVSETNFTTTANALVELKHHHVSDRIIEALLDGRSGSIANQPDQPDSTDPEPLTPGAHRLPNFDAAVGFNGKTATKIAVRQNHINVENAGHPLFSLTWRENNSN